MGDENEGNRSRERIWMKMRGMKKKALERKEDEGRRKRRKRFEYKIEIFY